MRSDMENTADYLIMALSAAAALLLLIFAVDWRYFRDWVVVFLFKVILDCILGAVAVERNYLEYPVRLWPGYFGNSLLFEFWVFPVLCVLYNNATRERGLWPIFYYAVLYSAGITALEVILERYTLLIRYLNWHWYTSLISMTVAFLLARAFIFFYRWGCSRLGGEPRLFR